MREKGREGRGREGRRQEEKQHPEQRSVSMADDIFVLWS